MKCANLYTALLSFSLAVAPLQSKAQVSDRLIHRQVLKKAVIGRLFVFGKWTDKGGMETHLRYLGRITTKHGQTFKILTSSWFWGLSHRATSRILVFNSRNQYAGNYYVTLTTDLPQQMKNGKLIFKNKNNDCDSRLVTAVNLKYGLPRMFFRKCKGEYGDIYSFSP